MEKASGSRGIWRNGFAGASVAVVANLMILAVSSAAGTSFLVPGFGGMGAARVTGVQVFVTTMFAMLAGTAATAVASRSGRVRAVQLAGALFAIVSLGAPLSLQADTPTKLSLAAMHLVAGIIFVLGVHRRSAGDPDRMERAAKPLCI